MLYYLVADLHLGHRSIKEFCGRPENFEESILKNIESLNRNAILINLGDFVFKDIDYWAERYREATKDFITSILVKGNHDKANNSWYQKYFDFVCESVVLDIFGKKVLFSHKPKQITKGIDLNIHGHFHNIDLQKCLECEPELGQVLTNKHKLISMERLKYAPIGAHIVCKGD